MVQQLFGGAAQQPPLPWSVPPRPGDDQVDVFRLDRPDDLLGRMPFGDDRPSAGKDRRQLAAIRGKLLVPAVSFVFGFFDPRLGHGIVGRLPRLLDEPLGHVSCKDRRQDGHHPVYGVLRPGHLAEQVAGTARLPLSRNSGEQRFSRSLAPKTRFETTASDSNRGTSDRKPAFFENLHCRARMLLASL